jgi:hypothetical protein
MAGGIETFEWNCPDCSYENELNVQTPTTDTPNYEQISAQCVGCEAMIVVTPRDDPEQDQQDQQDQQDLQDLQDHQDHQDHDDHGFNVSEFAEFAAHESEWDSTRVLAEGAFGPISECGNYGIWCTLLDNTGIIAETNDTTLADIHQFTAADFVVRCLSRIYQIPNTISSVLIEPCECDSCRYLTARMILCMPPNNDAAFPSYDVAHNALYPLGLHPSCPNKRIYEAEHDEIQRDGFGFRENWTEVAAENWLPPHDTRWEYCNCNVCCFELRHRDWINGNIEAVLVQPQPTLNDLESASPTTATASPATATATASPATASQATATASQATATASQASQSASEHTYSSCTRCGMNVQDDLDGQNKLHHDVIECPNAPQ